MIDEQEINMANGLFDRFLKVFDIKEYEYRKESLYFKFNAYGHLLQIRLLKNVAFKQLIEETQVVLREYNEVLNSLGIRGIEKFSHEINEKFGFVNQDFNLVTFLYKEKTDAYKRVIGKIFFRVDSDFLTITVSADMSKINIEAKQELSAVQYIRDFATSYYKISVDLYELHKEIMDILKDESMSHNAIEHLVYTKGIGSSQNDKIGGS